MATIYKFTFDDGSKCVPEVEGSRGVYRPIVNLVRAGKVYFTWRCPFEMSHKDAAFKVATLYAEKLSKRNPTALDGWKAYSEGGA
jgi:hypothetical protein